MSITMFYDSHCPLCHTEAVNMQRRRPQDIRIVPVDEAVAELAAAGISRTQRTGVLAGVMSGPSAKSEKRASAFSATVSPSNSGLMPMAGVSGMTMRDSLRSTGRPAPSRMSRMISAR